MIIHTLMNLPFDENALEPYISKETLQYHHGKHHAYYIDYRNARAEYLEKWWGLIDWDFVSVNLTSYTNK